MAAVQTLEVKNLDRPEETRPLVDKGHVDIVRLGGQTVGRTTFEPGWRWSEHVKPIAGTDTCQQTHLGYCISGRMKIRMNDGSEQEIGPGDVFSIPPGHEASIEGNETFVGIDFFGMEEYARRR